MILIFGEDQNDTETVEQILLSLCPDFSGKTKTFREPPVLIKDANPSSIPDRVDKITALIDAEKSAADVICVFAHEDCDQPEPAHETVTEKIETSFRAAGYNVHAVSPAWEMESWIMLWPSAVAAYRPKWRSLDQYRNRQVGMIDNAKETLRRALRPVGGNTRVRDYRESDAPRIAAVAREMGLIDVPAGRSDSFELFRERVLACCESLKGDASTV